MTRPNIDPTTLVTGMEAWDAVLRDMLTAILKAPMPVHQVANAAALPAATSYDRCLVCTIDTNKLWFSDGATWKEVAFV